MQGVPISDVERALGLKFHAVREDIAPVSVPRCKLCGINAGADRMRGAQKVKIVDDICSSCRRVNKIIGEMANGVR